MQACDTPYLDPSGTTAKALAVLDVFFTVAFTLEMLLKIFAFGLLSPPEGYFLSGWNCLDSLVVLISLVDVLLSQSGLESS